MLGSYSLKKKGTKKPIMYARQRMSLCLMLQDCTPSTCSPKGSIKKQPNISVKLKEPSRRFSWNFCNKIPMTLETVSKYTWKPGWTSYQLQTKVKDACWSHGWSSFWCIDSTGWRKKAAQWQRKSKNSWSSCWPIILTQSMKSSFTWSCNLTAESET